MTARALL